MTNVRGMLRRILSTALLAAAVLLPALSIFAQAPAAPSSSAAQLDMNRLVADAQIWLTDLLRMDTTNPPGNELQAAKYIAAVLQKENIPAEVLEMAPGRGVAIGRLQAGPLPDPSKALLLLGHLDVVAADKSKWTTDPFGASLKDGYLYGRGALDDKGMVVANLATIVALKRSGARLSRDVIFLADADEEQGDGASIKQVVDKYWDKIACAYAVNEGGHIVSKDGKVQYVEVQASEKVRYNVVMTASADHDATAKPSNPILHLAAALQKVAAMETPFQLLTMTRRYFEGLAQIEDEETAKWMMALEGSTRVDLAVLRLGEMNPAWGAMLRDTVAPTELRAGNGANAMPSEARATLDVRLLPGNSIGALVAQMQKAVNDPQVQFEVQPDGGITAPPSSLTSDFYQSLEKSIARQFPGAPAIPFLSSAATDSAYLRLHDVQAYGLLPFPLAQADLQRIHREDERIPLDSFRTGIEFLYRIIHEFVAAQ